MKTLRSILNNFEHTYIILDALDECAERKELLDLIGDIVDWNLDIIHILVTSRKERDIEDYLQSRVTSQINIQSTLVKADIQVHVRERLQNDPSMKKWPLEIRGEIEEELMEKGHRM